MGRYSWSEVAAAARGEKELIRDSRNRVIGMANKSAPSGMPLIDTQYPTAAPFAPPPASTVTTPESSLAGQSFAPLLNRLQSMPKPQVGSYQPTAPQFAGLAPVPVLRPPSDYYQNLFNSKFAPLQQDVFGKGGASDQTVGELNRRGFLTQGPSGVAGQLYEKTVTDPFARETANIQNQVNIIRAETDLQLSQFDAGRQDQFRQFMGDLVEKDRQFGVSSAQAQANIDQTYLALESEINQAIASGATEQVLAELNARVNTFQSLVNAKIETDRLNKVGALDWAKIEEERLGRLGDFWLRGSDIPGAIAGSTPFEDLGQPRPYEVDDEGNLLPEFRARRMR